MYVVVTATGTLYCGVSTDVHARVATHNRGKGAKYLQGVRLTCKLLVAWCFAGPDAHGNALRCEYWFKHQTRSQKRRFILMEVNLPEEFKIAFGGQEIPREEIRALLPAF